MLTVPTIQAAQPRCKPYALADGRGLHLLIQPKGGKWWRIRYRYAGKQQMLSLGIYPDVGLKDARQRRDEIRRQLANGIDPSAIRKAKTAAIRGADSFETLAREWLIKFQPGWSASYVEKITGHLDHDLLPWLGSRPVKAIEPKELLAVVRRIESRGALETAHRALGTAGRIFRYGVATGRADRDPTADLRGALAPLRGQHFAAITDPCLLYTSPSPRDRTRSRMPSSA